jgi:cardiolipin synthase (CMP-forming)
MNLANFISLARLLSVPLLVWLILVGDFYSTFLIFIVAGASDAIDGYVAKHFDQRTELGALLDPIADKTLIVGLFVTLGIAGDLPNWLVILVVFRDMMIVGGFLLGAAMAQPITWRPLLVSKLNTTLQIVLIAGLLAQLAFPFDDHDVITLLTYCVALTTGLSGAGYIMRWTSNVAGKGLAS